MRKIIFSASLLLPVAAVAAPSLSAQFEIPAKQSEANRKKCEEDLKALPVASDATPSELVKALKATPAFPKETAAMFEALSNTPMPTDKKDLEVSAADLDQAPLCWDTNALAIQFKGVKKVLEQGTKREQEDYTAALVTRLRAENKKQLLLLPLMTYLATLKDLANANLLTAAVQSEIRTAHDRGEQLASELHDKYPDVLNEKDNRKMLEVRKAELSASRQIQAMIDSILKKI